MPRPLLAAVLFAACYLPAATAAGGQPNIIFIMADDLGYGDLGSYGQQRIQTPHSDRMAADGVRFINGRHGRMLVT